MMLLILSILGILSFMFFLHWTFVNFLLAAVASVRTASTEKSSVDPWNGVQPIAVAARTAMELARRGDLRRGLDANHGGDDTSGASRVV